MHVKSWSASVCVSSSLFYVAPRVFFVVSFAFKPRTNLAMNFVRLLSAKVRDLTAARHQALLRKLVLDTVASPHSKRNYAKAFDDLFAFCASRPLSRSLLMEWRAGMESLSPSTINVRLSAVRKLVSEARRNNLIGAEEAASLTDIPNISQKGTRLGNWLTR